jgi:ubiquinone/menaquinone biosynthesis C-methylase UbiE
MKLYRHFMDGMPWYLARRYCWAYLWKSAVWFFDHQPVINAILFGQYRKLMQATLSRLEMAPKKCLLQLTCAYGEFTPKLARLLKPEALHITDAATIQLALAHRKTPAERLLATRMNAEHLGYRQDSFSTIVLFFLLHEMPPEARINTLLECMRTIAPGGTLLLTEYGALPGHHLLYRFPPCRWLLTTLEPFLESFWKLDLEQQLSVLAANHGKQVHLSWKTSIFSGFYRVLEFKVTSISQAAHEKW